MPKSLQDMPELRDHNVLVVFQNLEDKLAEFSQKLEAECLAIKLLYNSERSEIKVATEAITALTYSDEQLSRQLIQQPGVIFIPHSLVEIICEINQLKSDFMDEVKNFRKQSGLKCNSAATRVLRECFSSAGIGRVHLKQCDRKLSLITGEPKKITWYTEAGGWGKQKRLTKGEARALVESVMSDNVQGCKACLNLVNSVGDREFLVIRSKSPDSIKVNALFTDSADDRSYIGSLPVFVSTTPMQIRNIEVDMKKAVSKKLGSKKSRSKFEAEPLISSLNLYRYKPEHR